MVAKNCAISFGSIIEAFGQVARSYIKSIKCILFIVFTV